MIVVEVDVVRSRDGIWGLSYRCPHCQKVHRHGGGNGPAPDLGHRVSHCHADGAPASVTLVAREKVHR